MTPEQLLIIFLLIRFLHHFGEAFLSKINFRYYSQTGRQKEAGAALGISDEEMKKSFSYSRDQYRFHRVSGWINLIVFLIFVAAGGLGFFEQSARAVSGGIGGGSIVTGLLFFAFLGIGNIFLSTPFDYYHTFVIEEKHGFNRQTPKGFWLDRLKELILGSVLGGILLGILLFIMESAGNSWWYIAWLTIFGFSLLTAWIYPTLLAPIFNKFSPVEEGELKDELFALAKKVEFQAESISIMDASTRSTHGNAYFTGVFGKKKIVLFDNLVKTLQPKEIVAVLAHELGHFKLHHVRWGLIRSFFTTGFMFYLFFLLMHETSFYHALHLSGVSSYGALVVFSCWLAPLGFLFKPLGSLLSRRNEFAADAFAKKVLPGEKDLCQALLKLRQHSQSMPISHPIFSAFYHSHPTLLERMKAMGYL